MYWDPEKLESLNIRLLTNVMYDSQLSGSEKTWLVVFTRDLA